MSSRFNVHQAAQQPCEKGESTHSISPLGTGHSSGWNKGARRREICDYCTYARVGRATFSVFLYLFINYAVIKLGRTEHAKAINNFKKSYFPPLT